MRFPNGQSFRKQEFSLKIDQILRVLCWRIRIAPLVFTLALECVHMGPTLITRLRCLLVPGNATGTWVPTVLLMFSLDLGFSFVNVWSFSGCYFMPCIGQYRGGESFVKNSTCHPSSWRALLIVWWAQDVSSLEYVLSSSHCIGFCITVHTLPCICCLAEVEKASCENSTYGMLVVVTVRIIDSLLGQLVHFLYHWWLGMTWPQDFVPLYLFHVGVVL